MMKLMGKPFRIRDKIYTITLHHGDYGPFREVLIAANSEKDAIEYFYEEVNMGRIPPYDAISIREGV